MDTEPAVSPWRLFWAVPCTATPALSQALADLERWRTSLKITRSDQFHLTLKFLGDTATEQVEEVATAGQLRVRGGEAAPLECRSVGVFPPRGRPNVIWAGLTGADALTQLAARLDQAMSALGYAPERRAFQPHITMARVKSEPPRSLMNWMNDHRDADFGTMPVSELVLFRSELLPTGAVYTPVLRVPLSA